MAEKTINTLDEHLKNNKLIISTIIADGRQATVDENGVVSGGSEESRKKLLTQLGKSGQEAGEDHVNKLLNLP